MRNLRIYFILMMMINLLCQNVSAAEEKKTLTIYAIESFAAHWGSGPTIKKIFEKENDVTVKFVSFHHTSNIISRLRLEKNNNKADIILGLDGAQVFMKQIKDLATTHQIDTAKLNRLPLAWKDDLFIPYEYGYLSFISREDKFKEGLTSFDELIESPNNFKIAIIDPRNSSLGYDLLIWTAKIFDDKFEEKWKKLNKKVTILAKGWTEAWNLCMADEVDLVLSYNTSEGYHKSVNQERFFKGFDFKEGHFVQFKVVGVTEKSNNKEMARKFLDFLIRPDIQMIIAKKDYMHPVSLEKEDENIRSDHILYDDYKRKIIYYDEKDEKLLNRPELIKRWINTAL